ncbi:MAG: hypothetical protein CM15mV4_0790 [Caudoviricetes sp.]|nr:MAG: hypothetical protein CM15mV4_0790 [Caudoviricetes sp.]
MRNAVVMLGGDPNLTVKDMFMDLELKSHHDEEF